MLKGNLVQRPMNDPARGNEPSSWHAYRPPKDGAPIRETNKKWLVKDCCGIFTAIMVYCLILFPMLFIPLVLSIHWSLGYSVTVNILLILFAVMAIWSHCQCMCTNPGAIPLRTEAVGYPMPDETILSESAGMRFCIRCNGPKSPRAHHCSTCDRCILKMDHHCPWMNNCIGMSNMKYFALFLLYIFFLSCTAVTAIVIDAATCGDHGPMTTLFASSMIPKSDNGPNLTMDHPHDTIGLDHITNGSDDSIEVSAFEPRNLRPKHLRNSRLRRRREINLFCGIGAATVGGIVLICLESAIFGVFSLVMLIDAISSAASGSGGIEALPRYNIDRPRLKHQELAEEARRPKSCYRGMVELFGGSFGVRWFLPVSPDYQQCVESLTDLDLYLISTTYFDRYVVPRTDVELSVLEGRREGE